ncbi:HD domain-containing protein, partial [Patescibacteria group bacterium]|nr:HD domain-containing protein [Patescibacteria group bacterium]
MPKRNLEGRLSKKNEGLYGKYTQVKGVAKNILTWSPPYDFNKPEDIPPRYFTDHGIGHTEGVIKKLNNLTQNLNDLEDYEIFFLLCGAWLHDIGMFLGREKGESLDTTREYHHERSAKEVERLAKNKYLALDELEVPNIANLCHGHRRKFDVISFPERRALKEVNIRVRLLVSLLRIADACDYRPGRSPRLIFDLYKEFIPERETKFWEENFYIASIDFEFDSASIDIWFNFSDDHKIKSHQERIAQRIKVHIQKELQSVEGVFKDYKINLFRVFVKDYKTAEVVKELEREYPGWGFLKKFSKDI